MFGALTRKAIEAAARRHGSDPGYLLALHAASPAGFRKFARVATLASHREAVSAEASHAARLVGSMAEDCGPCVQIEVGLAQAAGVADGQIEAVLRGEPDAMAADTALAWRFARAVLARSAEAERDEVRGRWGERGVIDLTLALMGSRLFPMAKAGLGFGAACQRVTLGERVVEVVRTP